MDEPKLNEMPKTVPAVDAPKSPVEDLSVETYEPKKNCRKCYGTGRLGFIEGDFNKPYYCNCIMKVKKNFTPVKAAPKTETTNEPQAGV